AMGPASLAPQRPSPQMAQPGGCRTAGEDIGSPGPITRSSRGGCGPVFRRLITRALFVFTVSLALLTGNLLVTGHAAPATPAWTELSPAHVPPRRAAHVMGFDANNGRVLMFGGFGPSSYLKDTWYWNGSDWTKFFTSLGP